MSLCSAPWQAHAICGECLVFDSLDLRDFTELSYVAEEAFRFLVYFHASACTASTISRKYSLRNRLLRNTLQALFVHFHFAGDYKTKSETLIDNLI